MNAEIIAIGSELTCGARLDTNSKWLSEQMEGLGWKISRHTTVADDREAMVALFKAAVLRSRVVLITGGLGPTLDDITRETLAAAVDRSLVEDAESLQHITAIFANRGREMPERNRVQALLPEGAACIFNAQGTAPGILLELQDPESTIAVMPGVPAEMYRMFNERVVPQLPRSSVCVKRQMLRTFGFGESDAEQRLGDLTDRGRNPEVGITASQAVISLSITAQADSPSECDTMIAQAEASIRQALGDAVFARGDADLADVVGEEITARRLKIALLEGTTTGGLLAHWLSADEAVAARLTECRVITDHEFPTADEAESLLKNGTADYVLVSTAASVKENEGMLHKRGLVELHGSDQVEKEIIRVAGNLAIFRERAARHALNLLRLSFLKASS